MHIMSVRRLYMERAILHIDINHCYAQIEEMKFPQLRDVPMAVGGHEETRHGIILAKNDIAKTYGIQTGETLRDALDKCEDLLIIPPHYKEYIYYTNAVKDIYRRYSDRVESFGLDEAWIDITSSLTFFKLTPYEMAKKIQREVLEEIGLTVSVGVSYNKVFAKLGSDMKKPLGLTCITKDNFKEVVWPLPVSDLLYVGYATTKKLHNRGIFTIGDLANYNVEYLKKAMGVHGEAIHAFANGREDGEVGGLTTNNDIKSIGNSITLIHDVYTCHEVFPVLCVLCESIASRLRDANKKANVISVVYRTKSLQSYRKQMRLNMDSDVSSDLLKASRSLLESMWDEEEPIRSIGVSTSSLLEGKEFYQVSLFEGDAYEKERKIDLAMDYIRNKYGFSAICKTVVKVDEELCNFNPKEDHTIHPVGYFQGRSMVRK